MTAGSSLPTYVLFPPVGKLASVCYDFGFLKEPRTMSDAPSGALPPNPPQPHWQPLGAIDRRVLGVLAEKAKTTPDIYPMSLNAICTGCNQKSNRAPLMQLEPDEVEESLDRLRESGAVGLVEGYGRVAKYRHYLYEWLGVDKVELAVMTELLLRGDQTVGELRGRASRMEPIADLAALRPVLDSLKARGLVVALTPDGRGHVVTHALYRPRELEVLKARYQGMGATAVAADEETLGRQRGARGRQAVAGGRGDGSAFGRPRRHRRRRRDSSELAAIRDQMAQMRRTLTKQKAHTINRGGNCAALKEALAG